MRSTHFLSTVDGEKIAVDWYVPEAQKDRGTAVFIHGFGSHRRGEKALFFADQFQRNGWNFLSIDLQGHGDSGGGMEALTLTRCLADLETALDWLPGDSGQPVLIGSSMGGAVGAWFSVRHPGRVAAMVMIAPALGFPSSLAARFPAGDLTRWKEEGRLRWQSDWMDVTIGYDLLDDGESYDPDTLVHDYRVDTLIFHGMLDDSVDWRGSQDFLQRCSSPEIELVLLKTGDHRLTDHKTFLFGTMHAWLSPQPGLPSETPPGE